MTIGIDEKRLLRASRGRSKFITAVINGISYTLNRAEWDKKLRLRIGTVGQRIRTLGWTDMQAIEVDPPPIKNRSKKKVGVKEDTYRIYRKKQSKLLQSFIMRKL